MDLVSVPRSVSLVVLVTNAKMASPAMAASIVVKNSKNRVLAPDWAGVEKWKMGLPEAKLIEGRFIEVYFAIPQRTGGEGTV